MWVELFPGHTAQMMAVHLEPPRAVESRPSAAGVPHACYTVSYTHLDVYKRQDELFVSRAMARGALNATNQLAIGLRIGSASHE